MVLYEHMEINSMKKQVPTHVFCKIRGQINENLYTNHYLNILSTSLDNRGTTAVRVCSVVCVKTSSTHKPVSSSISENSLLGLSKHIQPLYTHQVPYHSSGLGQVVCLKELSGSYSNATEAVGFHLACSLPKPYTKIL